MSVKNLTYNLREVQVANLSEEHQDVQRDQRSSQSKFRVRRTNAHDSLGDHIDDHYEKKVPSHEEVIEIFLNEEQKDLLKKRLAILEKSNPRSIEAAGTIVSLGKAYYENERQLREEILLILERDSPMSLEVARLILGLAVCYNHLGQYRTAHNYLERALPILKEHNPKSEEVARVLIVIGIGYNSLGEYRKAKVVLEDALHILRENNPKAKLITVLVALGIAYNSLGEYGKTKVVLEDALHTLREYNSKGLEAAMPLVGLGTAYNDLGQYENAKQKLQEALPILQALDPESLELARTLVDLGKAYNGLGQYENANNSLKKAVSVLQALGPWGPGEDIPQLFIGKYCNADGQYETARQVLEQALAISKRHNPESLEVARTLLALGKAYNGLGQYEKASQKLEEALAIFKKRSPGSLEVMRTLKCLSDTYVSLHEYRKAESQIEEALATSRKNFNHPIAIALNDSLDRIRSLDQPQIATSSGAKPSSWINDLFGWVKSSVSGLLGSKPALPEGVSGTTSPISQVDVPVDVNGTIMLLDLLIRKVTGQKYISTADQSISPLEAQGYALNITKGLEKVVQQAGLKSGVSMHRLNIDYMGMQKEIVGKVIRGQFNKISGVLSSYLEKACPSREAGCPGKLSSKKLDKFMVEFNSGLDVVLNQSIEQILHNRDGTLEVDGAKQMSLEPQSYLSNASVQGHLTQNKVKLIS